MAWRQRIMRRSAWITFHLCVASFFAPVLLLMAISGGLYLLGFEGSVKETPVTVPSGASLDLTSHHLEDEVRELLMDAGIDHRFEYVGGAGHDHSAGGHGHNENKEGEAVTLTTYPTSRVYYVLQVGEGGVQVTRHEPDFQERLIQLHTGNGPGAFKYLQRFMAVGLILMVLSGFSIGLSSVRLRTLALSLGGVGLLLFVVLAFIV